MSEKKKQVKGQEEEKACLSKKQKGEKKDDGFDESLDWAAIADDVENIRFSRDKATKEGTHKWWIGWSDKAFQPPYPGSTDFLTLKSFVKDSNDEMIRALKKWVSMNNDLLELIEKAVGGKEVSGMAFQDQQCFVDYIEMRIIDILKKVTNIPLRVLSDEMLEMLFVEKIPEEKGERLFFWSNQAVHLVKNIGRCTQFTLFYTPHLDKRNFEITTFWKEFEGDALPYGKNPEIDDYCMNLLSVISRKALCTYRVTI